MLDTVVISAEYVCCSVAFDTLIRLLESSVIWSE